MPDEGSIGRRDLLRLGGVAVVGGAGLVACKDEPPEWSKVAPGSVLAGDAAPSVGEPAPVPAPELEELSFADLQARMADGRETARSLVAKYRARIDALDRQGPTLRAVLEVNPDAEAIADRLDGERKAGAVRGPLHGVPILVKDNIDTGDRMTTTAGSLALEGTRASKDAALVARLREAGAIILGKANLSEWANFRGLGSSSGWSGRGGQCKNPYALDRSPSGSSSGSGVATAANLCAGAIGSETDGSIVSPAACNGLVGLKPTVGLVSRAGIIPISSSQDTAGPMTRTVADAAALLTAIAGADPADPSTTAAHPARPATPEDYTRYLDPRALAGARLGVIRAGYFGVSPHVDAIGNAALEQLKQLGAVLVDPTDLPVPPEVTPAELTVLATELEVGLDAYLASRTDTRVRSLVDLIAFNKTAPERELGLFGQELFELSAAKGGLTDPAYLEARALCLRLVRDELLDKVMAEHHLDAFVAPTGAPAWLIDHVNGDSGLGPFSWQLAAIAGYPHVTVPAGQARGLPVGLSFWGRAFADGKLLGYAFAFEQATRHRRPPRFLPSTAIRG